MVVWGSGQILCSKTASFIDFFRCEGLRCEPVHGQRRGMFIAALGSELYYNTFDSKKVTPPKTNMSPKKGLVQ